MYDIMIESEEDYMTQYFKLSVFDDKQFALSFKSLTAQEWNYVLEKVRLFPERKYDRDIECWYVPFSEANIDYLFRTFKDEEYELDEESKLVLSYHKKRSQFFQRKENRRCDYVFNDVIPEVNFDFYTKPYDHQTVGLDSIHNSEFFGLLMEQGTGKTKIMIDEIRWAADTSEKALKVLIICPKSLRGVWEKECVKHLPPEYSYWIRRLHRGIRGMKDLIEGVQSDAKLKIWIINYESIQNMLEALSKMRFDIGVCDESQKIKSATSKRTKACLELSETIFRRFIMTGTPIANRLLDLWPQFQFLSPGCLGYDNYHAFKRRYYNIAKSQAGYEQLKSMKNVKELMVRMAQYSFVVKKKDCLDLPPKIYKELAIEMGDKQYDMYIQMRDFFLASLTDDLNPSGTMKATAVIAQLIRLSQICSGFIRTMEGNLEAIPGGDTKLKTLEDIIEQMEPDQKCIIWARFHYDIDGIYDLMTKKGIKCVKFTGKQNEKEKDLAIESFNRDFGARLFISQAGAGGEGLTLLGGEKQRTTDVIYYSQDFSFLKRAQSEDRCHRVGTNCSITYHTILCENTIDEYIHEKIMAKKELGEMITNIQSIRSLLLGEKERGEKKSDAAKFERHQKEVRRNVTNRS